MAVGILDFYGSICATARSRGNKGDGAGVEGQAKTQGVFIALRLEDDLHAMGIAGGGWQLGKS